MIVPKAASPKFVSPMLALVVAKLPEGPAWSYELKFDGYRALGIKSVGRVRLLSRNGKDFAKRFASIASALEALPDETVIDGEIVAYDVDGRPSFNVLQNYRTGTPTLHFYAFDLLTLRRKDLTGEPLEKRRKLLRTKVMPKLPDSIRYPETLDAPVGGTRHGFDLGNLEDTQVRTPPRKTKKWIVIRGKIFRRSLFGDHD